MSAALRAGEEPVVPVAVDVTFLRAERRPRAADPPLPLPPDARVERTARCSLPFYRYLYETVGREHVWWLRRAMPDTELAGLLGDPRVSVHVLYRGGEPAGFYELDRRPTDGAVNLSYFGLMPRTIGRGLGRALLRHALEEAWRGGATRAVTVNTCTADHPRALPNYLAAGFVPQRTVRELWRVPVRLGLPIPARLRARG